jgi:hypothetical protein
MDSSSVEEELHDLSYIALNKKEVGCCKRDGYVAYTPSEGIQPWRP